MKSDMGISELKKCLHFLPSAITARVISEITNVIIHEPVIGIVGKTGAGKSSLCNALFKGDVSPVSDVKACTREALRFRLKVEDRFLTLIDLPGLGENQLRDREYSSLYQRVLPEVDLVLWIIKADDRALTVDEHFYKQVLGKAFHYKVLFIINQADKIEPCHEWLPAINQPSSLQVANLEIKISDVVLLFEPVHTVCPISAKTGWNLDKMVETMTQCFSEKSSSCVSVQLHDHLRTERVKEIVKNDFGITVGGILDVVASLPAIPKPVKSLIHQIRDAVVSVARSLWDFFF